MQVDFINRKKNFMGSFRLFSFQDKTSFKRSHEVQESSEQNSWRLLSKEHFRKQRKFQILQNLHETSLIMFKLMNGHHDDDVDVGARVVEIMEKATEANLSRKSD